MADFFEQAINNYSGSSTETKPTRAAGNNVPNGSRWREVDTAKTWHYNKSDDAWYLTNALRDDYYKRAKYFYDANDNLEYLCRNTDIDAADADTDWDCFKFTWIAGTVSGFNATTKEGPLQGAVDSVPSGLAWNT